jgi:hypothetical protein
MKKKLFLSVVVFLVFMSCASAPELRSFSTETGKMYFIPPTNWEDPVNKVKVQLDITYHTGNSNPAVINITFFGKKTMPRRVISVSFNSGSMHYPLENIKVLFADSKKRHLRITTEGDRELLTNLLEAESITFTAEVDGSQYVYVPDKQFNNLKDEFLVILSY